MNNIRERHSKILGNEDWELFRQTIRILEICGKLKKNNFFFRKNFNFYNQTGELILAYEQFESSLAQQMLQMINEWQNKTHKFVFQNLYFYFE